MTLIFGQILKTKFQQPFSVRQKFLMELKLVQPLPPVEQQIQQIRDPEQQIRDPDQRTQYPKRSVVTISRNIR
jgi:hypothetical protein